MPSCGVCLSVRLSVTFVYSVETNKHIFNIFSPSGSHTILVFLRTKCYGNIPMVTPQTVASNAGGVSKNRDSRPISGYQIDDCCSATNNCDGPQCSLSHRPPRISESCLSHGRATGLFYYGWLRSTVVERWSLTGKLSLSSARPTADG